MNTETTDPPLPSASSEPQFAALLACWGKFSSISGIYHPALYHMLDAGHVAQCLLADGTDSAWCRIVARSLSADAGTLAAWLPFWVALHDLGKLTIPFQGEQPAQAARLRALGFKLDGWRAQTYPHSIYSAALIRKIGQVPLPQDLKTVLTHAIGGHHGLYPRSEDRKQAASDLATYEAWDSRWDSLRQASVAYLANVFCPLTLPQMPEIFNISTAVMTLTGFIILVDWLASDETIFKFQPDVTPDAYLAISRAAAAHVVEMHGINRPPTSAAPTAFNQLFTMLPPPRPLQSAIDDIPQELLTGPCLAIIEAPTGEGKTEAALALAHRIARSAGSDAFYYALPTTATSNQMYTRVSDYLDKCLHLPIAVKLVHGQAWLKKDDLFTRIAEGGSDSPPLDDWYDHKKRALLAPFGVGTIDQAELAALNVKHNALRMLGLAGKVVILDEVHAYDAYMSTIIERLLEWLAAVGSSVILLSATLPAARRQTLLQAYAPNAPQNAVASYPNIDIVPAGAAQAQARASGYHAEPAVIQPERVVHLGRLTFGNDIESSAAWLLQAVAQGGCACWIANTVRRAQELFMAVDRLAPPDVHHILLHSRFPLDDRAALERCLVEKYGREGARPERGIIVGTQVLEQSLDLDFDVMVSDLAPIDLLLQRAGRLQRHPERNRPPAWPEPHLWLAAPAEGPGLPELGVNAVIYDPYVLYATLRALGERSEIHLPADYRTLIEAVYGTQPPEAGAPLRASWESLQRSLTAERQEALQRLLPSPNPEDPFCLFTSGQEFEEDEQGSAWINARTRLGLPSATVIPLVRRGREARLWPQGPWLALDAPLERNRGLEWLRRGITLSHRQLLAALRAENERRPAALSSPLLKRCLPLWLEDGRAQIATGGGVLNVSLDHKLGLVITSETQGEPA